MKNKILSFLLLLLVLSSCSSTHQLLRETESESEKNKIAVITPDQQRKYDYFFLEAMRLKELNSYSSAFGLLQHCLDINPSDPAALYEIAQYYMYLKQDTLGVSLLEKAVALAPDNYWYSQALCLTYQDQKQINKAIALLEDMVTRFPANKEPLMNLFGLYNQEENYEKMIYTLNRLEKRMGKNEQLSMQRFSVYQQMNDEKRAFAEIENLVKDYPANTHYKVVLGDLYMQYGKSQKACDIYNEVLAVESDDPEALYSLASYNDKVGHHEVYRQLLDSLLVNKKTSSDTKVEIMQRVIADNEKNGADSTKVVSLFSRALEEDLDDAQMPLLYAQYLLSKKMYEAAVPVLETAIQLDPTNKMARLMLISCAVKKDDYKQIINVCESGIIAIPDAIELYYYLAVAYNESGRTDEVIQVCNQALEHITSDSKKEVVSDFYSILGDSYYTKKQSSKAFESYESALKYNASNIPVLNNYAYYLSVEHRNLDKAEEMSYKTVKSEPGNATYIDTYAWILFEKGKYAEAKIYIDSAMKGDGSKSDVIVEHCGDIYFMNGDVEDALMYWKKSLEMGNKSQTLKQKIEKKKYIAE
ncbi:MAG: hypothetical protein WCR45_03675 [Bacteroidaceae bacterium]